MIGVPVNAALDGMDALLSITQMPARIPVAFVGIRRGDNAAILAAQIMVMEDRGFADKLAEHRRELAEKIELDYVTINEQKNQDIQD